MAAPHAQGPDNMRQCGICIVLDEVWYEQAADVAAGFIFLAAFGVALFNVFIEKLPSVTKSSSLEACIHSTHQHARATLTKRPNKHHET